MANSAPRRSRIIDVGIVLVFLSIITAGFAGATFLTAEKTFENRPLASWPQPTMAGVLDGKLLTAYTETVRDRHMFRQHAVIGRNWLQMNVFGDSTAKEITYGADGWMFLRGAADHNCRRKTSAEWMAQNIERYLQKLPAHQEKIVTIFPNKDWVYLDKVKPRESWIAQPLSPLKHLVASPSFARTSPVAVGDKDGVHRCSADRYAQDIDAIAARLGDRLFDVRPLITEHAAKSPTPIYLKQDTHWTHETSAWMGGRIVDRVQPGIWRDKDVKFIQGKPLVQDLSRIAGVPSEFIRLVMRSDRPGIKQVKADSSLRFSPRQPVRSFASVSASADAPLIKGKTAIVYDSFLIPNYSVISPYFEDVTWLFWDDFERPEVQKMIRDADRVIFASIYRLMPERAGQMAKLVDQSRPKTN